MLPPQSSLRRRAQRPAGGPLRHRPSPARRTLPGPAPAAHSPLGSPHNRPRQDGQRGSASVELVIATPLLLLLLLGIVQFALWEHATHIAQAAAAQGLAAARVQGGGPAAGTREATTVLGQLGTGVLQRPTVHTQQTANTVQVSVRGQTEPVLPFLHLPVAATAAGPVEQVYAFGATP